MAEHVGIAREEDGMRCGLQKVLDLQERVKDVEIQGSRMFNPSWHIARDDIFMLTIAEAVIRAAIERRESRGAHFRTDYREKDPELAKVNFVVCKQGEDMEIKPVPIPPMPSGLARLLEG